MMVKKEEVEKWLKSIGQITIKNKIYWRHPIYNFYAADMNGNVININREVPIKGNRNNRGYLKVMVRRTGQNNWRNYLVHRFVYECVFGLIPEGFVIDHLNSDKEDNRLINLQLVTPKENSLRGANNCDYSFTKNKNWNKPKPIKAIDIETEQIFYFNSMSSAGNNLGINAGTISRCCLKEHGYKTGISKKDGKRYKFKFTTKVEITKY